VRPAVVTAIHVILLLMNANRLPRVSVIVRTAADANRFGTLRRALDSVLTQQGVFVEPIVVVNSPAPDPTVMAWLRGLGDARIEVLPTHDHIAALRRGRELVTGESFCFLDDDDEYLPGALARRSLVLDANSKIDCVVTRLERSSPAGHLVQSNADFAADLAGTLARGRNWMASCSASYRTSTVTMQFFDDLPRHCEFKVIAFRVASSLHVVALDMVTHRVHDSEGSLNKDPLHKVMEYEVFEKMLRWRDAGSRRALLRRSKARALHRAAEYYRQRGEFSRAWVHQWQSLTPPYGLRYVPFVLLLLAKNRQPASELRKRMGARSAR